MNSDPGSTLDARPLTELGFYTLAGQADSSRDLVDEVRLAERLGLGSLFISERFDKKEAAVLSGAAGAVSERMTIVTAATNHNTRHPMITAGMARTMQSLTGGRFILGLGRGIPVIQDTYGIDRITTGAARGLRRPHAPAVPGRGHHRPRRALLARIRSSIWPPWTSTCPSD